MDDGFAERLRSLIGERSVSAFARQVGLSEALIRKYLRGSEPSLSKANQIAMQANCSLEWLATGCGYLYRQAEVVDHEALVLALDEAKQVFAAQAPSDEVEQTKTVLALYQYLRGHKKTDGYFERRELSAFAKHLIDNVGRAPVSEED